MATRRRVIGAFPALAFGLPAAGVSRAAFAQAAWPARPVRFVVPFAAGGPADVLARFIGKGMAAELGQPVVIDNKGGAGGTLGASEIARASDGHSFLFASTGALVIAPGLTKNLSYDPDRDLVAIGQAVVTPSVFVVSARSPYGTLDDLVRAARADPGKLNFASAGSGTTTHLVVELLKSESKIHATHLPYRGAAPAITDVIGGTVDFFAGDVPGVAPFIKGGQLKGLALAATQRSTALPQVPTTAEAGHPRVLGGTWYALVGPAATPPAVVARLNAALNKVLRQDETASFMAAQGAQIVGGSADEFAGFMKAEAAKWGGLARAAGVTLD